MWEQILIILQDVWHKKVEDCFIHTKIKQQRETIEGKVGRWTKVWSLRDTLAQIKSGAYYSYPRQGKILVYKSRCNVKFK